MNDTLEFFDFQAPVYDTFQQNCIPKYLEMLNVSAEFLAHAVPGGRDPDFLDLGCGTGNTTRRIKQSFPNASVCCLDGSAAMITEAKKKLAKLPNPNVRFENADLESLDWSDGLPDETFDGALSVLVLEHLPFEAYRRLLSSVYRVLKPGGWLLTVEGYAGVLTQALIMDEIGALKSEAVSSGLIPGDLMAEMDLLSLDKETHYFASMDDKKSWWNGAGFGEIESIWQYYCVGILVGRKPPR
jgi:tRNA (cmo5U34)-methyltransferase